ncbi:MAG: thiolase family protein [Holosporaceae bacterium]|nr:thiolase family protein [Holosporaceae bacterium]
MDPVVIASAARTPLGAFNGKLKSLSAVELGKAVVNRVVDRYKVKIDGLYMGCVLSAGLGQSAARQIAIGAGLGPAVNCINVNKICGSGMASMMLARNALLSGEIDIAIAGGMESMTNAPYLLEKIRTGYRFGNREVIDHILKDGLLDAYEQCVMGYYAEDTASAYSFTRADQDEYAQRSFIKALRASEDGHFKREIVPLSVKDGKLDIVVDRDEIPFSTDLAKMPFLKPAFAENGTITAASASSISDGAAAVLLMRESFAKQNAWTPLVRVVAQSSFSQSPKQFTTAPLGAIRQVLEKSKWTIASVDLFEINEAFAVVPMAAIKEFSIDPDRVNVFGGACSLGHPLGASGARIVVTLLNAMATHRAKRGLATLCVGGGEGVAMTFESL